MNMKKTINNELKTNLNELISPSSYRVSTSSLFILAEPHPSLRCDIVELFHTRHREHRDYNQDFLNWMGSDKQ